MSNHLTSLVRPLHELRGALTGIELGLSALERSRAMQSDILRLQLERARLALADIDVCLDGGDGRDERARAELVDLSALVTRSARAWSQLAPGGVRVLWRAGAPACVEGHPGRLAQAIENVVGNAVEHGGGRVLVEGEVRNARVRVAVSDGGPGVPPAAQTAEASAISPHGHGLAITRDVIAGHGGELLFERGEEGPAVVIELPLTA